ncbi:hypothetical protein [Bacillus sp. ISL-37]|uniref:hypothetical protein n=1 Tax=Bacillus sp. ISL-37 TaxID=2819123 RepID=UPI001BEB68EE|nr:hypothetical protein [Bacillus sp. ISL-37]MBT2683378.1 hypothetical protein [Bacillus sp. ISL-37]
MRIKLLCFLFFTILLVGCSNEKASNGILVEQNLVHLNNGTPEPAKKFFEEKIGEADGGLHTFLHENQIYLMLFEPNRQISQVQEFTDHIRVITTYNNGAGTFDSSNEIINVLYIKVIEKVDKPFTVMREEDMK